VISFFLQRLLDKLYRGAILIYCIVYWFNEDAVGDGRLPPVPPPGELDKTASSGLFPLLCEKWRHTQNRK